MFYMDSSMYFLIVILNSKTPNLTFSMGFFVYDL